MNSRTIGVFDSGVGGFAFVKAIQRELPQHEVIFANDAAHVPYGTKPIEETYGYVVPILQEMVRQGCELIVIACNTVTTNLIDRLRKVITVPLIGVEPMVKVAAQKTRTNKIIVCATPATLNSKRYAKLKEDFAQNIQVIEPDCGNWSYLIESNRINHEHIAEVIEPGLKRGADVIVLGCTHYHWIDEEIQLVADKRAAVINPEKPVVEQVTRVLAQLP